MPPMPSATACWSMRSDGWPKLWRKTRIAKQRPRQDYWACRVPQPTERVSRKRSGDLLPPSPPAEKATARQDQTGKSCTGDGTGNKNRRQPCIGACKVGIYSEPQHHVRDYRRGGDVWVADVEGCRFDYKGIVRAIR